MKLRFSRKTWYFCLLATAALNLLNGMAARTQPAQRHGGPAGAQSGISGHGGLWRHRHFGAVPGGAERCSGGRKAALFSGVRAADAGLPVRRVDGAAVLGAGMACAAGGGDCPWRKGLQPDDRGLCSRSSTPGAGAGRGAGRQAEPGPVGKLFVGGAGRYVGGGPGRRLPALLPGRCGRGFRRCSLPQHRRSQTLPCRRESGGRPGSVT